MRFRLRDTSHIDVPALFLLASVLGMATAVVASAAQLFIGAYNPLYALSLLPYVLLMASPICLIAGLLALSAGLGSRALARMLVGSGRAAAISAGLVAAATGVAVALVMAGPLGGFGPAFWTGSAASAIGGVALVAWALHCSQAK